MKTFFQKKGQWYRGNLHMHTTRSDGALNLSDAVQAYRDGGYDFIAVTDHRRPGITIAPESTGFYEDTPLNPGRMLVLAGVEWDNGCANTPRPGDGPCWHILGIGMQDYAADLAFARQEAPAPQQIVDHILSCGGLPVLAHPAWSLMDPKSLEDIHGLHHAEIYNTVSGHPWNGNRAEAGLYFDLWASWGRRYMIAMAGDDAHHYNGDQCASATMVKAESLSRKAIMAALSAGQCYATQGPLIRQITYDTDTLRMLVECSREVTSADFLSNRIWARGRYQKVHDGRVEYQVSPDDLYVRIELSDAAGRRAWTSPLPLR